MTKKYSNRKRADLLAWFHKEAEPLVETYKAALRLLEDKSFPDRIHLISHAVREICNRLPDVLDPQAKDEPLNYAKSLGQIEKIWPSIDKIEKEPNPSLLDQQTVNIDLKVVLQIDSLVQAHRQSETSATKFERLFRLLMRNHPTAADVNSRIAQDFKKIAKTFVSSTHVASKKVAPIPEEELQGRFTKFEDMLYSFVGNFFTGKDRLDELLTGIRPEQIDEVIALIASPHHEAYFFKELQESSLIVPLENRGVFSNPLSVEHLRGGGVRYPPWAPSAYLARMAHKAPEKVAAIFSKIKTDNPSIMRNIVSGALAMPGKIACNILPVICQAARNGALQLCFEEASNLCAKLAEEGELNSAESLARAIFNPHSRKTANRSWDQSQYKEGLEKVVPVLAKKMTSDSFLKSLCYWLKHFIEAGEHFDANTGSDYSYIWRPAIEEHSDNHDYRFADTMIGFVREGFEQALENGMFTLQKCIEILDNHKYPVFERIKIHLINKFAEKAPDMARQIIMDRDIFENHECQHEYALLVGNRLPMLTANEQDKWFSWLDKRSESIELINSGLNDEQKLRHAKCWKYQRLHWIRAHLKENQKKIYESMRLEFVDPNTTDPDACFDTGIQSKEVLIDIKDLLELSFQEAIEKVSKWQPSTLGIVCHSMEGLATTFQEYLSIQPKIFSEQAELLIDRPAIYVRKFIAQMILEIKSGREVDIPSILELCLWVLSRPVQECTMPKQDEVGFLDKDWTWTRDEIALLIRSICQATSKDAPTYSLDKFRKQLWDLIANLHSTPDDSPVPRVSENDPRGQDYIEIGINSSRGKIIEVALAYARWVFTHSRALDKSLENFGAIPEVKNLIEARLASKDCTPGELALIGSNVNLIYAIDKRWLEINVDSLFPICASSEDHPKASEWAAWNAFLVWTQPHIEFYRIFRKQFVYAAEQGSLIKLSTTSSSNPIYRLGEHLAILYARGEILLEEKSGSFRQFLLGSRFETRRRTIEFVGRLLDRQEAIPPDVITRCKKLWETYWLDIGEADAQQIPSTWPFETWFSSGKFPAEWSIQQLEKYLQATEAPDISNQVVEELANIAETNIGRAVRALDKIVRGDKEDWRVAGWQNSAYTILAKAIKSDEVTSELAQKLIDHLGRSGYMQFGTLLKLLSEPS